jgi:hypothetical protein
MSDSNFCVILVYISSYWYWSLCNVSKLEISRFMFVNLATLGSKISNLQLYEAKVSKLSFQ